MDVTTKERGWAGHFIGSNRCLFRRNTLITYGDTKWIVSTVGNMRSPIDMPELNIKKNQADTIGYQRWYETMVFESSYDVYDDPDVSKEIHIDSDWGIWGETLEEIEKTYGTEIDIVANDMHDRIVEEMKVKIKEVCDAKASSNVQRADNPEV